MHLFFTLTKQPTPNTQKNRSPHPPLRDADSCSKSSLYRKDDFTHHARFVESFECCFERVQRIALIHDRLDIMLLDECEHFFQFFCARHRRSQKIVLAVEEFTEVEVHRVTCGSPECNECSAALQLIDGLVERHRTDPLDHNVNFLAVQCFVPVRFAVDCYIRAEVQGRLAFLF